MAGLPPLVADLVITFHQLLQVMDTSQQIAPKTVCFGVANPWTKSGFHMLSQIADGIELRKLVVGGVTFQICCSYRPSNSLFASSGPDLSFVIHRSPRVRVSRNPGFGAGRTCKLASQMCVFFFQALPGRGDDGSFGGPTG